MTNIVPLNDKTQSIVLDDELSKLQGMGSENVSAKDILIPRLVILQSLSPQINKKKAEFIEHAEVGDFCNVATSDIYKESVFVIPCYFITNYIQWGKNRGGLVNNFGEDASVLQKCSRNEKQQNILPNGDVIEETAQWYCLLSPGPGSPWERIFFPLKATNLKHSRKWMTLTRAENVTVKGEDGKEKLWKPPLFWRSWKLNIVDTSNDSGDWFTFRPEKKDTNLDIDPSRTLLNSCMEFYNDVKVGKVKVDMEATRDDDHGAGRSVGDPNDKDIPF